MATMRTNIGPIPIVVDVVKSTVKRNDVRHAAYIRRESVDLTFIEMALYFGISHPAEYAAILHGGHNAASLRKEFRNA